MQLTHTFTVPADRATTWAAFTDVSSVAECFPGAVVESTTETEQGTEFTGSCKVKLGPIALVYSGVGRFVEQDEAAGRMVLTASGKDKRGNGTAGADVTVTLSEEGERTAVQVVTDLKITGKPAQFGRGVMQDVSDKLLGQFTACLEQRVGAPAEVAEPASVDAPTPLASVESVAAPTRVESAPHEPEALDLGATVIPVLIKAYGKQLAGVGIVLAIVAYLLRRRR